MRSERGRHNNGNSRVRSANDSPVAGHQGRFPAPETHCFKNGSRIIRVLTWGIGAYRFVDPPLEGLFGTEAFQGTVDDTLEFPSVLHFAVLGQHLGSLFCA